MGDDDSPDGSDASVPIAVRAHLLFVTLLFYLLHLLINVSLNLSLDNIDFTGTHHPLASPITSMVTLYFRRGIERR